MLELWDNGASNDPIFITNGPIARKIKTLDKKDKNGRRVNLKPFVKYQPMRDILIPNAPDELLQNQDFRNYYMLGLMIITGIPIKKLEKINLPTIHKGKKHALKKYDQSTLNTS